MNIYYNDGVQACICVHTCSTIEEAKKWISEELQGFTMVDDTHPCSEEEYRSSKVALYQVYDGAPITIDEDGMTCLTQPIYVSAHFYTE